MKALKHFVLLLLSIVAGFYSNGQTNETSTSRQIKNLTIEWNKSIATHDMIKLAALYADSVSIYGNLKTKAAVISSKETFIKKYDDFTQTINGKIITTKINQHKYRSTFSKQSGFAGKIIQVNGYLIFDEQQNGDWKISGESDDVTDKNLFKNTIGTSITGDFNGDSLQEKTSLNISSKGENEDIIFHISIQFGPSKIKPLNISPNRDDIYLINEGNLNNIPGDEITVYTPPLHGCTYAMSTYTYADGAWKLIMEPFLIPTACDEMSDKELQNRIFKESNVVYYYDTDVNDEHFRLVKKKAELKTAER